ncbi:MAG: nucleotidyltransferase domain-containing protein [Armatimonadetes bacterium]|nr:nucleotidyltransferase domain-containing protein [Armatimonadota bacterium]
MAQVSVQDEVVARFLDEKLDLIRQEYSPTQLIVFGSRAEGRAREDSDIDLIVVSEKFKDIRFPNRMGQFLTKIRPHVPVDALCYTPEDFEIMLHKQAPFVRNAVSKGIHIE